MAKNHFVTGDQYRTIHRKMREIACQLDLKGGSPLDPQRVDRALQQIVEGKFCEGHQFLRRVSPEPVIVDPTDGPGILADAIDLFTHIDPDFRNWKADERDQTAENIPVSVYVLAQDATLAQMFASLATDVRKLCLKQAQIKSFVKEHSQWLNKTGHEVFFLFMSYGQLFVAYVNVRSNTDVAVRVRKFDDPRVWEAMYSYRVVVPHLD